MEKLIPVLEIMEHGLSHSVMATKTVAQPGSYRTNHSVRDVVYAKNNNDRPWEFYAQFLPCFLKNFFKIDGVHFHSHADRYFLATILLKITGKKIFYSATLDDSVSGILNGYRPFLRPMVLFAMRLWDGFIAISQRLYDESKDKLKSGRTVHIPIGIHIPPQSKQQKKLYLDQAITCVFVGGLCARKDPLFLVEEVIKLRGEGLDLKLILVGPELEPDYVQKIDALILESGLQDCIIRIGRVENPGSYYAQADIFTFTSHSEGFGTVVIEAMSHGLPAVVRRLPGVNEEFVRHGETGFLFDDEADFAGYLRQLVGDASVRDRMGQAARQFVCARYDFAVVARSYLNLYGVDPDPAKHSLDKRWGVDRSPVRGKFLMNGARSSALDKRLHRPVLQDAGEKPVLVTSIDTEEEFDWAKGFFSENTSVTNILEQECAQKIHCRYGVVPAYLLTYPVVESDNMSAQLREWADGGLCEIGAHLHPWVTPPLEERVSKYNSFAGNLDPRLEFDKLNALTLLIKERFNRQPTAFRAGRYGVSRYTTDILRVLGYKFDLSILPNRSYQNQGGVSFWGFDSKPFWTGPEREVLEIPATSEITGMCRHLPDFMKACLFNEVSETLRIPGALAATGYGERIRLSPEAHAIDDVKRLTQAAFDTGQRVFSLSYHSSSLLVGATPFVQSQKDKAAFLDWLDRFYDYFLNDLGGEVVAVSSLRLSA